MLLIEIRESREIKENKARIQSKHKKLLLQKKMDQTQWIIP